MGINPINNISKIIRILFAVTLFQQLPPSKPFNVENASGIDDVSM
jgi:hypothetical protein